MNDGLLVILFSVILIILILSLVYATASAAEIGSTSDPDLSSAHWYLSWTVSALWIIIAMMIVGVIALIFFGPEFIPIFGETVVYLILFVMVAAIIVTGVISSIAAYYINRSPAKDTSGSAYTDSIVAAVSALGSLFVIIVVYFLIWHYGTPQDIDYSDDSSYVNDYQGNDDL